MTDHSIIRTLDAELDEGAALLRPHLPEASDDELRRRAECMRPRRYETGRWPPETELAEMARFWRADAEEEAAVTKGVVVQFSKKAGERLL
jgi:hypothetical protein